MGRRSETWPLFLSRTASSGPAAGVTSKSSESTALGATFRAGAAASYPSPAIQEPHDAASVHPHEILVLIATEAVLKVFDNRGNLIDKKYAAIGAGPRVITLPIEIAARGPRRLHRGPASAS